MDFHSKYYKHHCDKTCTFSKALKVEIRVSEEESISHNVKNKTKHLKFFEIFSNRSKMPVCGYGV